MKVILLQDVKSLGKKGAMVEVNEGYARNFIIPKKLGMEATPKNMNDFKLRKAHEEKVAAENLADAKALAAELEKASVTVKIKVGEGGDRYEGLQQNKKKQNKKKQTTPKKTNRACCKGRGSIRSIDKTWKMHLQEKSFPTIWMPRSLLLVPCSWTETP